MSNQRFDVLSLIARNVLLAESKSFQLHGDKQIIVQILPTAPDRAFVNDDCYDSSLDLGSISYTDILQRLLRLGFQIQSSTSGSYSSVKNVKPDTLDTLVLQYTLIRSHSIG